jgi:Spy/CpxP family protein refolding chaperone
MKKLILITVCFMAAFTNLFAQQTPPNDPIGDALFSPEFIMQNQQAINLTENQRNTIARELQNAQSEFMNFQWDLSKEAEKLKLLLEKQNPAEATVMEQMDRLLAIENRIKKKQIALLIRIKTLLTNEQQEKLQKIKGRG